MAFSVLFGLSSPGATDPHMALPHRADSIGLHQFHHSTIVITGVDLSSHLSGHTGFCCGFSNDTRFVDTVCEWFFAVDVFAQLQGRQGGKRMGVFTGADHHRIELIGVIVKPSKIRFGSSGRVQFGRATQIHLIHITQSRDFL